MKKTAKNVLGLFFCILMISMCTGTIPAFAASSGMIHIQLEDLDSDSSDKKGVSFELYCVGTVGDSGEPVFDTKYNITAYPKTAEETEQVIQQISTALDIDAQETAVTDENGEAVFRGLADGIYYIKAVNAKGYGTVEPVLVHLPFSSAGTGAGSRLEYEVYAKPKASAKPTDPVKPDQPKQPNNEKSNPETSDGTSSNTSNIASLFGPKTGDSTPIAGALLLLAAGIALIAGAVVRKRKQK